MLFIQITGLSGAGKSTIAYGAQSKLSSIGVPCEVVDGDQYRQTLSKDLGFSRADRIENIKRLSRLCTEILAEGRIAILAAINPYEASRSCNRQLGGFVKTVWVHCELPELFKRDTKGLYRRSQLPIAHKDHLNCLTGVNDTFEKPERTDLIIDTTIENADLSIKKFLDFILSEIDGKKVRS